MTTSSPRRLVIAALGVLGASVMGLTFAAEPASPKPTPGAAREITWDDLMPQDWDPMKEIGATDPSQLKDGDPRAAALMKKMQAAFDNAPVNAAMDGAQVKIPGYIVPLEQKKAGEITEFLLVPYFGACIHTPPPPANQILHVHPAKAAKFRSMDAVWVVGTLKTARSNSGMGVAGYRMEAQSVTAYTAPASAK